MNLDKNIISQIWDGCEKQIVNGYVYIKMDDLIKLETKDILNNKDKSLNMNKVANYLNNKGFKYNTDGETESWVKK